MNKMMLILLPLFLLVLFPVNLIAQDDKELLDQIRQIINIEPTPCRDEKGCYCFEFIAKADSPLPLRYAKSKICPVEVRVGHIILAFKSWDRDRNKVDEGRFINGKMDGVWTSWHPNGVKAGESHYTTGKQNGQFTTWHDNGQIAVHGNYRDDKANGEWSFWDKTGRLTKKLIWDNGKLLSKEEFRS
jgi:hypothetical protein